MSDDLLITEDTLEDLELSISMDKPDISYKVFKFNEFELFIKHVTDLKEVIALDVECRNLRIWEDSFTLGGIGFSDGINSYYLVVNSIEERNQLTPEFINGIVSLLQTTSDKTILVYNQTYEKQVFDRFFQYKLKVFDVFLMLTCLGKRASLKENSRNYLGSDKWEDDTLIWTSSFLKILKKLKTSDNGKIPKAYKTLINALDVDKLTDSYDISNLFTTKELMSSFSNMKILLEKYYADESIRKDILYKTILELRYRVDHNLIEDDFTFIPSEIVSIYCIHDCINTVKLYNLFIDKFKSDNLEKAYDSYSKQADLAVIFEKNGCLWDDRVARTNFDNLKLLVIDLYKKLFSIDSVQECLGLSDTDILTISTTTDMSVLESYFTPRSYKKARVMVNTILTTELFKFALFLDEAKTINEKNTNRFKSISSILNKSFTDKHDLEQTMTNLKLDLVDGKVKLSNIDTTILLKYMKESFEVVEYQVLTQQKFKEIFQTYFNVNVEHFESYRESLPEFYFFMIFFLLKKALKELSGYNGILGRETCFKIDETNALFYKNVYENTDKVDDFYFYKMRYNPNAVATRRWASPYHTIPNGSDLRKCIKSHLKDEGLIVHWDLSI